MAVSLGSPGELADMMTGPTTGLMTGSEIGGRCRAAGEGFELNRGEAHGIVAHAQIPHVIDPTVRPDFRAII
jgi:hypothetical protein